jgi:hypothetical protein
MVETAARAERNHLGLLAAELRELQALNRTSMLALLLIGGSQEEKRSGNLAELELEKGQRSVFVSIPNLSQLLI